LLVLPGLVGRVILGFYILVDWAALDQADRAWESAVQPSADLNTLLARAIRQHIHRINVFAEGVWFLLSAMVAAIGLHGLAIAPRSIRR